MRVGRIGLAAPRQDAQHLVLHLDANLDEIGVADGVDPEGAADLPGDFLAERMRSRIEKKGFGAGAGSGSGGRMATFSASGRGPYG
jgi:hypothetical protein